MGGGESGIYVETGAAVRNAELRTSEERSDELRLLVTSHLKLDGTGCRQSLVVVGHGVKFQDSALQALEAARALFFG